MTDQRLTIQYMRLAELKEFPGNPKLHDKEAIGGSARRYGFNDPMAINEGTGHLVEGHGRREWLLEEEAKGAPPPQHVVLDEATGKYLVPVVRGISFETDEAAEEYLVAHNAIGPAGGYHNQRMAKILESIKSRNVVLDTLGMRKNEVARILRKGRVGRLPERPTSQPELKKEAALAKWKAARGQIWEATSIVAPAHTHRLICGDAAAKETLTALLHDGDPDILLTDPPYSSGGFQEAGRKAGSIGTRQKAKIASDQLSTRGYLALISSVLDQVTADAIYLFTDWRMWAWTYDVAERHNFPVRAMLVWDKGQMGMGFPWRSTHELVLFGKRTPSTLDEGKAGNVLRFPRSGNVNHPTEKPLELMEHLIENTPGDMVLDTFAGSGTTLVAAEKQGRVGRGVELDPGWFSVCLEQLSQLGLTPRQIK